MADGIIYLYCLFIYGFIVMTRNRLDYKIGIIMSIIIANLVQMDAVSNFSNILWTILFEVVISIITYAIIKLTFNLSKLNLGKVLYVIEALVAIALTAIYYFLGNLILIH